ncbi:hypothetical protein A9G43_05735 [Gilliamella sp. Occ3-1]|uniref:zeta toxin family protein n=2 Tax=Gilliamella sp. Occ3-1 TaxID=3120253 RepID=UPI00080E9C7B|nr:zeta toxin family protein [Gilliamella apicola]OCG71281.1 hypothetical protein A9G43_05735 [Gilliamella apicola]
MNKNEILSQICIQEKSKIINDVWNDIHIDQPELISQQSNPKAYVMGGQPGAGKSTSTNKLETKYKNNILTIDLDAYRERHPNFKALYEKYGKDSAVYTHEFASEIKEEILKRAIEAKYNIIVDGTLKNTNKAKKLIETLKNKGYQVDVLIHTCPKEVSWDSVNNRYENALKAGRIPRYVPKHIHDKVVAVLPNNADELSKSSQIEKLSVYNREKQLFDSKVDKGLPSVVIQAEINKNDKQLNKNNLTQPPNDPFSKALQTATERLEQRSTSNQKTRHQGMG